MGATLDALYPGKRRWRLPTLVVCGEDPDVLGRAVAADLAAARGLTVGYAGPSGTTVGSWVAAADRQPVHVAHRLLIEDPTTEAIVVATTPERVLADGAGVARADVVALMDGDGSRSAEARRVLARTGGRIVLERDASVIAGLLDAVADTG